ncbi:MAG: DnaJ domain-containing protein [Deltaproteobacteria bacterium]|jgi:DnaJ-class molecular chaperone|nr:DnaJ domain-containing protein [Deltaproteobacteria bacterium]
MPKNDDFPALDENPQHILGVPQDANAAEIRTAYLNKIKEYPPEKYPAEFERVRDAYTILSDARYRTRLMLQSADPEASLVTLLDNQTQNRQFVGPEAWLAAMRKQ